MAREQLFEDEVVTECEERVDIYNDEKIDRSFSSSERLKEIDQIYASVEDRLQIAIQELAQIVKKDTSSFKLKYFKKTLEALFYLIGEKLEADCRFGQLLSSECDYTVYTDEFKAKWNQWRAREQHKFNVWKETLNEFVEDTGKMERGLSLQLSKMRKFLEQ
ncbi:uncharacterized protein LOC142353057 [Convolutriloba macropyga]|uniref:uncharacterized protein LOC142353057 n=1 Tax=Convolutriloba macropyga TaxID=536237 RepID=UPI003F526321